MSFMTQIAAKGVFGRSRRVGNETVTSDYGGHSAACGFHDVNPGDLIAAAKGLPLPRDYSPQLDVDGEITIPEITKRLAQELDQIGPYGTAVSEPALVLQNVIYESEHRTSDRHTHLQLKDDAGNTVKAIFYNGVPVMSELNLRQGMRLDVVGMPDDSARGGTVFLVRSVRQAEKFN